MIFNSEKAGNRLVKRLIGVAGDKIAMSDNKLIINDEKYSVKIVTIHFIKPSVWVILHVL